MFPKIKLYTISTIIVSLIIHILWVYEQEVDIFEGIWRVVVLLFLVSLLRKNHEQQEAISKIQKHTIFFLSIVTVVIGEVIYLQML